MSKLPNNKIGMVLVDFEALKIFNLLMNHFNDAQIVEDWLCAENPLLGYQIPMTMIQTGRGEKLRNFIECQLEGNTP